MSYNFFEPFLLEQKPERKDNSKPIFLLALILMVAFIGVSFGYTVFEKNRLQNEIASIDAYFEDETIKAKVAEIDAKLAEITDIKLKAQYLQYLEKDMKSIDIVNDKLLDFIKKEVVNNLSIEDMSINKGAVSLNGLALTKTEIAQFEYDLRNSGNFFDVFVPNISKQDGYYTFDIHFDTVISDPNGEINSPIEDSVPKAETTNTSANTSTGEGN